MAGCAAAVAVSLLVGACGGSAAVHASKPPTKLTVQIPTASFPARQRLAQRSSLVIAVRNAGARTIPDVSVTICNVTCAYNAPAGEGTSAQPFAQNLNQADLESRSRPVWIVNRPPGPCRFSCQAGGAGAGMTSYSNTWSLGALAPGATAKFQWGVTAVAPGRHTVAWEVAGDLNGKTSTALPDGARPIGRFRIEVRGAPAPSHLTASGQIVPGPA